MTKELLVVDELGDWAQHGGDTAANKVHFLPLARGVGNV